VSTTRVREFRKRKNLGLMIRKVRITPAREHGSSAEAKRAVSTTRGIAIEAYLGDSL
jgi:hypothetical protein